MRFTPLDERGWLGLVVCVGLVSSLFVGSEAEWLRWEAVAVVYGTVVLLVSWREIAAGFVEGRKAVRTAVWLWGVAVVVAVWVWGYLRATCPEEGFLFPYRGSFLVPASWLATVMLVRQVERRWGGWGRVPVLLHGIVLAGLLFLWPDLPGGLGSADRISLPGYMAGWIIGAVFGRLYWKGVEPRTDAGGGRWSKWRQEAVELVGVMVLTGALFAFAYEVGGMTLRLGRMVGIAERLAVRVKRAVSPWEGRSEGSVGATDEVTVASDVEDGAIQDLEVLCRQLEALVLSTTRARYVLLDDEEQAAFERLFEAARSRCAQVLAEQR